MKKILILITVLLIITACSKSANEVSIQILQQPIIIITIEDLSGPRVAEIKNEDEINAVVELLKLDEWKKVKKWNLKLAPNLFVVINNNIIIGLFDGDNYAKMEGSIEGYYEIPKDVNLDLIKILDNLDEQKDTTQTPHSYVLERREI